MNLSYVLAVSSLNRVVTAAASSSLVFAATAFADEIIETASVM